MVFASRHACILSCASGSKFVFSSRWDAVGEHVAWCCGISLETACWLPKRGMLRSHTCFAFPRVCDCCGEGRRAAGGVFARHAAYGGRDDDGGVVVMEEDACQGDATCECAGEDDHHRLVQLRRQMSWSQVRQQMSWSQVRQQMKRASTAHG